MKTTRGNNDSAVGIFAMMKYGHNNKFDVLLILKVTNEIFFVPLDFYDGSPFIKFC